MGRLTDFGRQMSLYFGLAEEVDDGERPESPLATFGARLAAVAEIVRRTARRRRSPDAVEQRRRGP